MKALRITWKILSTAFVTAVAVLAILLVGVRLIGLSPYAVLSGSMEPTYRTGGIVYVKKVDYRDLKVGDPITFLMDETTVATHRIVEIVPDEEDPEVIRFRTKGDANEEADGGRGVHCKNIIGKPVFTVPYLGYVANFIQNPPGRYLTIAGCALMVLLVFLPDLFGDNGKKKKKEQEGETPS